MKCPFCNRTIEDFLKHLAIVHEIQDADQYRIGVEKIERSQKRKQEFASFVSDLREKRTKGLISAEEYRAVITDWFKEKNKS